MVNIKKVFTLSLIVLIPTQIISYEPSELIRKTGQTKSYNYDGNEVTDGSIKDDGYYQKGITPNYTRDDTKDIVIDNITGLQWQDDSAVSSVMKRWLEEDNYYTCKDKPTSDICYDTSGDTSTTYCTDLNLGTYTDWRLPTIDELSSIIDFSKFTPAINTVYFHNTNSELNYGTYHSSTTYEYNKFQVWSVMFEGGAMYASEKNGGGFIRCVRDRQ